MQAAFAGGDPTGWQCGKVSGFGRVDIDDLADDRTRFRVIGAERQESVLVFGPDCPSGLIEDGGGAIDGVGSVLRRDDDGLVSRSGLNGRRAGEEGVLEGGRQRVREILVGILGLRGDVGGGQSSDRSSEILC